MKGDCMTEEEATTLRGEDNVKADTSQPPITDEDKKAKRIAVVEIFGPTIQGEGPLAGSKTMFVRFGGCDYRCVKCDSLRAVIPGAVKKYARYLTAEEIADELIRLRGISGTTWVTLSGGNPCMWDLTRLIQLLKGAKFGIAVETQGTLAPEWLSKVQMVVISPKSPGMGEKFEPEKFKNVLQLCWANSVPVAVKVVVFSALDIEFACEVEECINSANPPYYMSELLYLSLGNPYPPALNEDFSESGELLQQSSIGHETVEGNHRLLLLDHYKVLLEEFTTNPRMVSWRFLPQIHVLVYSNEAAR